MEWLIRNDQVKKAICSFTRRPAPRSACPERVCRQGLIDAELCAGHLGRAHARRGAGIPAFYTPAAVGTELARP